MCLIFENCFNFSSANEIELKEIIESYPTCEEKLSEKSMQNITRRESQIWILHKIICLQNERRLRIIIFEIFHMNYNFLFQNLKMHVGIRRSGFVKWQICF